jgi:hypothetical protein
MNQPRIAGRALRLAISFSSLTLLAGAGCLAPSGDESGGSEGGSISQIEESPLTGANKCISAKDAGLAKSEWVYVDDHGKLAYKELPKGERILDFSYAGYHGGGVALPDVPVKRKVAPSGGDDTAAIQHALDAVAADNEKHGDRGAVLLAPGHFHVSKTLTIDGSGVVLRGSGSGDHGTQVSVGGAPHLAIRVRGAGSWKPHGAAVKVTDAYVPSGTRSFHVEDASSLHVGQTVLVDHEVTAEWVHFMGMDHLHRDGKKETWIKPGTIIHADRIITGISGHLVTVDAPIPDSYDHKLTKVTVTPYTFPGRIHDVGVESLRLVAPKKKASLADDYFAALDMDAVIDGWIKDVVTEEFLFGVTTQDSTKWLTIEDTHVKRTAAVDGSNGWPFAFSIGGEQTLVLKSSVRADDTFAYATQAREAGPNAVVDFTAEGDWTSVQPHQRWATGLLLDNVHTPKGSIDLIDRGIMGSGHGWTIGFSVVWNGEAATLDVQRPPGAENWVIGTKGKLVSGTEPGDKHKTLPRGIVDSLGDRVAPRSLYLAQLCQRLGPKALANIGY